MALQSAIAFAMRKAGVAALKEKQRECILKFVESNDVKLVPLLTGYRKSLIYGFLPDLFLPVDSAKAATLCNFFTNSLSLCVDLLNKLQILHSYTCGIANSLYPNSFSPTIVLDKETIQTFL